MFFIMLFFKNYVKYIFFKNIEDISVQRRVIHKNIKNINKSRKN